jgi:hypothetical protein
LSISIYFQGDLFGGDMNQNNARPIEINTTTYREFKFYRKIIIIRKIIGIAMFIGAILVLVVLWGAINLEGDSATLWLCAKGGATLGIAWLLFTKGKEYIFNEPLLRIDDMHILIEKSDIPIKEIADIKIFINGKNREIVISKKDKPNEVWFRLNNMNNFESLDEFVDILSNKIGKEISIKEATDNEIIGLSQDNKKITVILVIEKRAGGIGTKKEGYKTFEAYDLINNLITGYIPEIKIRVIPQSNSIFIFYSDAHEILIKKLAEELINKGWGIRNAPSDFSQLANTLWFAKSPFI